MLKIHNEKQITPALAAAARAYCETVGGQEIYNVAHLGGNEYRIMYWIDDVKDKTKRKMVAIILPLLDPVPSTTN